MKIGLLGAGGRNPPRELVAVAAPDTVIQNYPRRGSVFARTQVEFAIQHLNYLDIALTAAADGCDALVSNTFSDYGLAAMKAAVSIPVVGAAEATMRFAPTIGPRFSIVTIWPENTNYMPRTMLRDYGVEGACARIRNVSTNELLAGDARPDLFITSMQRGAQAILSRIIEACEAAAREDDIDAILLGCTCMSPIAARVAEACTLPVLNPLAIALKTAEMQASLHLTASRRGQGVVPASALDLARKMVDAIDAAPADDCPVCAITESIS